MNNINTITFAALAEPTRLSIIDALAQRGELAASDISDMFKSTPSAISQHLKVLRNARLVVVKKRAQQRIYALDSAPMLEAEQWLQTRLSQWNKRLDAMEAYIEQTKEGGNDGKK